MQNICKTMRSRKFWLSTVLPFVLALAAAFIARYQLELSDGVTPDYMAGQWPLYAPLNALTAFCLTLVLFAFIGRWSLATGLSGALFTVLAIVNYYTRDLHGTALMPQDIMNIGTAAAVMGSYTLRITKTVITIVALYIPVLIAAAAQRFLVYGRGKAPKINWKQRLTRWAGCFVGIFLILYVGYFAPFAVKPKQTYGWAWQLTYYKYGYLAGTIESAGLPLTDYYKYLLAMKEEVPLMTAGNDYMDAYGATHLLGENPVNDDWVNGYFALEYNNIGTHAKKNEALFSLNG